MEQSVQDNSSLALDFNGMSAIPEDFYYPDRKVSGGSNLAEQIQF